MTDNQRPTNHGNHVITTSLAIVAVHLLWLFVGPFAIGLLLWRIVESGSGWLTGLDLGLLIVVVLMLCARWIDQRSGQAAKVYGEPAIWADFRRYVILLPVLAGVAWIVASIIGNHF